MTYKKLSDLERDLDFANLCEDTDAKTQKIIAHAILKIRATDNKITTPWIFEILQRNKNTPHWDTAYKNWVEIRKIFGRNSNHSIIDESVLEDKDTADVTEKLTRQEKLHYHIQCAANAIQEFKVTEQNIDEITLLVCTIIGLNERYTDLDQGILISKNSHWFMQTMKSVAAAGKTRFITDRTGKNRTDNFQPIYHAAKQLINKFPLLGRHISFKLIAENHPLNHSEEKPLQDEKKPNKIDYHAFDEKKFDSQSAAKTASDLTLEIEQTEARLAIQISHLRDLEAQAHICETLNLKIEDALSDGHVIDYDQTLALQFNLTETEQTAWQDFAAKKSSHFLNLAFNNYIHQAFTYVNQLILGEYQTPEDVMRPLIQKINERMAEVRDEKAIINQTEEQINQLKSTKKQIDVSLQAASIAAKIKQHVETTQDRKHPVEIKSTIDHNRNINETKNIRVTAVASTNRSAHQEPPRQSTTHIRSWWKRLLLSVAETGLGVSIGWGVGFAIGTILGIFFGGGIGAILTAPLCGKIGAIIGGLIGGTVAVSTNYCNTVNQETLSSIDNRNIDNSNTNIFRRLCICPCLRPSLPHQSNMLDHKQSRPTPPIIMSTVPAIVARRAP